uniref:RING-type domain-containing protein n=1 Tax=Syphacia muris TaxID=451379 RepID=A0A158R4X2_9BILA
MTDDEQTLLDNPPEETDVEFVPDDEDQSRSNRLPETVVYVNDDSTSRVRFSYLDVFFEVLSLLRDIVYGWFLHGYLLIRRFIRYLRPAGTIPPSSEQEAFLHSQLIFCLPFSILLLLKIAPKIFPFLLNVLGAGFIFIYCDNFLSTISLASLFRILYLLVFAATLIAADLFFFGELEFTFTDWSFRERVIGPEVYTILTFGTIPESADSSFYVVYTVFMTGMALKLIFIGAKALAYLILCSQSSAIWRFKLCYWLECSSHVYQFAIPIPQWFHFFSHSEGTFSYKCYFFILAVVYVIIKVCLFQRILKNWLSSTVLLFWSPRFKKIDFSEIQRDMQCIICISSFKSPVKLNCNHIFCRKCIETWFSQHNTCPICRAIIYKDIPKSLNYTFDSSFVPVLI